MEDKVVAGETEGKVVLGDGGLLRVEAHLVASQPVLVLEHSGGIHSGSSAV